MANHASNISVLVWANVMRQGFFEELVHFATTVMAYALALLIIVLALWTLRKVGWRWPKELITFLERLIDANLFVIQGINVEYRDLTDLLLDLGPYVTASLRNGRGGSFELREGYFTSCDPDRIRAGTVVVVSIQEGLIREILKVQLDLEKQILFVRSRFTHKQVIEQINCGLSEPASKSGAKT